MALRRSRSSVRANIAGMRVGGFKMAINKVNKAKVYSTKHSRKLKKDVRCGWNRSLKQAFDFYNLKFIDMFKSKLARDSFLDRKMVELLCSQSNPFLIVNPVRRRI